MVTEFQTPSTRAIFTIAAQPPGISGGGDAAPTAAAVAARESDADGGTEPARASTDPGAGSDTGS